MSEEKYISSRRGKTYYWVTKSDSDINLVFLPGLTANHTLFEKQVEFFKGRYNILVWDCPAHGKSRPYADFSYKNISEELKTILDTENVQSAIFIGQSLGGMVAQYFINLYPSMAKGFISIDSVPFGDYYSKSDLFWLQQLEWICNLFPDSLLRKSMAKICGTTPYTQDMMLNMLGDYSKKELCHLMYIGEAAFIPENCEVNLPCPVLLLMGEKDKVGKVRTYNKKWMKKTGYPLHIIKGAAHNSNQDRPELVNKMIENFINSL